MTHLSLALGDQDFALWPDEETAFPAGLVFRPTWNFKGDLRFLSLRKWLNRYKHDQSQQFRRAKEAGEETPVSLAVEDCIEALKTFGNLSGFSVVPAPVGRSGAEAHFASKVARRLAAELGLEYAAVLETPVKRTKSVVGERSAKLEVRASRVPEKTILFDDVATTGATLQGCIKALEGAFVIAVAWIYLESDPLGDADLFDSG